MTLRGAWAQLVRTTDDDRHLRLSRRLTSRLNREGKNARDSVEV